MPSDLDTLTARQGLYDMQDAWPSMPGNALLNHDFIGQNWPREREEITVRVSQTTWGQPWFTQTWTRIQSLAALGPNWNGYGEARPHAASVKRVIAILDAVNYRGSAPGLVPLSDGGLQIEWHQGDDSLEIVVPPSGPATVWLFEGESEESWDLGPNEYGVSQLVRALRHFR